MSTLGDLRKFKATVEGLFEVFPRAAPGYQREITILEVEYKRELSRIESVVGEDVAPWPKEAIHELPDSVHITAEVEKDLCDLGEDIHWSFKEILSNLFPLTSR